MVCVQCTFLVQVPSILLFGQAQTLGLVLRFQKKELRKNFHFAVV